MRPAFRAVLSLAERKAERTAHVARELLEAEAEARQATTARLRAARLENEADTRALAAQVAKDRSPRIPNAIGV